LSWLLLSGGYVLVHGKFKVGIAVAGGIYIDSARVFL